MPRKNLMIILASLLLALGVLLSPGSFSSTAHAGSKESFAKNLASDTSSCKTVKAGDTGELVSTLQEHLISWYKWYSSPSKEVSRNGGPNGKEYKPNGALEQYYGAFYYSTEAKYKKDFAALGAKPDGKFGPATEAAVEDYQRLHADKDGNLLAVDGVVGPATWNSLGGCKK